MSSRPVVICKDRSEQFFKLREDAKQERKLFDKNQFLSFKLERSLRLSNKESVNQLSFPNIFSNKKIQPEQNHKSNPSNSSNLLINKPYCGHCGTNFGLFTSSIACELCKVNFCIKCINTLSSNDITGVLREGQVMKYCAACIMVAMSEEQNRRYYEQVRIATTSNPYYLLYNEQSLIKKAIIGCMPNFEYLASSITDFKRSSPQNRETFLHVYEEVIKNQDDLSILLKEFDTNLKKLISLPLSLSPRQESVRSNMKRVYVNFLQENLPKFKTIQNEILHIEMNTATNIYTIICCITLDDKLHRDFWNKFQNIFQDTISVCRKDLFNAVIKCGVNWDQHKALVDEAICSKEHTNYLKLQNHPSKEFEGTVIRKNMEVVKHTIDQITLRVKPDDLLASKTSLQKLYSTLEIAYNKGQQF